MYGELPPKTTPPPSGLPWLTATGKHRGRGRRVMMTWSHGGKREGPNFLTKRSTSTGGPPGGSHGWTCLTVADQKSSRCWKTPSVILSFKNKSLPLNFPVTISDLKCREIFTQVNHPFQRHLRRIGRAATVLVKAYTDTFVTLQLTDQNHLIDSFLTLAREKCASTGVAMGGFELDVERMFPSIPRERVSTCKRGEAARGKGVW